MLSKKVECRPVWKPMHKQPAYADAPVYTNGVEEDLFKVGMCLPAGPYVSDDDVRYIVDCIKEAIVNISYQIYEICRPLIHAIYMNPYILSVGESTAVHT